MSLIDPRRAIQQEWLTICRGLNARLGVPFGAHKPIDATGVRLRSVIASARYRTPRNDASASIDRQVQRLHHRRAEQVARHGPSPFEARRCAPSASG
jgi:hypothetical protein